MRKEYEKYNELLFSLKALFITFQFNILNLYIQVLHKLLSP